MSKDKVVVALSNIIMNKVVQLVDEIKISDIKKQLKYVDIDNGCNIFELTDKISLISKEYNIDKKDIYITSIREVGSYESDSSLCVSFEITTQKSTKEMQTELKARASTKAYQIVYKEMIAAGFNRVGFSSSLLKDFDNTSIAEMIQSKDYSRLIDYYSLYFDEK